MRKSVVQPDGAIQLGEDAIRAGFRPGSLVDVILTRAGSVILALDTSPPPIDAEFKALVGGAAQLAMRGRRS